MHLNDELDFVDARPGWIAPLPDGGIVRDAAGNTLTDAGSFAFVKNGAGAPDSVNPGLWRQSRLVNLARRLRCRFHCCIGCLRKADDYEGRPLPCPG